MIFFFAIVTTIAYAKQAACRIVPFIERPTYDNCRCITHEQKQDHGKSRRYIWSCHDGKKFPHSIHVEQYYYIASQMRWELGGMEYYALMEDGEQYSERMDSPDGESTMLGPYKATSSKRLMENFIPASDVQYLFWE